MTHACPLVLVMESPLGVCDEKLGSRTRCLGKPSGSSNVNCIGNYRLSEAITRERSMCQTQSLGNLVELT
jgi:hypothetical protein